MNRSTPSFGAVVRLGTQTLVEHLTPLAMTAAIVVFPMTIWQGALPTPVVPSNTASLAQVAVVLKSLEPWIAPQLVDQLASFFMGAAVVWMLAEAMGGHATSPAEGYRAVLQHFGRLVSAGVAEILVLLATTVALTGLYMVLGNRLGLVVDGVLVVAVGVYLSLVTQVVMRENQGFFAAVRQSARLVSGAFWPVLGLIIVGAVVTFLFSLLGAIPASGGVSFATRAVGELITAVVAVTVGLYPSALLTAFFVERTGAPGAGAESMGTGA